MAFPEAVRIGYLLKRSQNKGRITAENYRGRLFVLTHHSLKYYDGSVEKTGKKKGEIALKTIKVVENVDDLMLEKRSNAFQVVYCEDLEYFTLYMVAGHFNEREEWVRVIREEAIKQEARFLEKYHRGVWTKKLGKFNCCDQVDRSAMGCVVCSSDRLNNSRILQESTQKVKKQSVAEVAQPPPLPKRPGLPVAGESKVYIAVFDFEPQEDGDLELCKGDQYEILDDSKEHWWLAKNRKGQQGYIPSNYVKKKFDLEIYDWYYKDLARTQVESILKESRKEGCFLVRDSASTPGQYSLSLYTQENPSVRHYHIRKNEDDMFYISEQHVFVSIPELVNYHKHNAGGLVTRLKEPPHRSTKPTTAGFGHSQFEIDPAYLEIGEELGAGCFGSVHRGIFKGVHVAVKRMKQNTMGEDEFIEEAKIMTQLSHKNLVQLYGVVTKQRPLCIVTELMRNGALNRYLQRHASRLREQAGRLLDMCVQVCEGMAYLESRNFIHRDLAARNCLVGDNSIVKVADFGLARYVLDDEYQSSAGTKFPVKWAPPEVLQYTRFSSKSDVWAYGVLMWEVFTCGQMPYQNMRNVEVVDFVVTQNLRLAKPGNTAEIVYQTMLHCWEKDPEKRPKFEELFRQLSSLNQRGNYS